ncbi:MAG: RidA family protein [Chloroflexi bacterium]|nr:RidA family protein [Chloroflexota bacterium]
MGKGRLTANPPNVPPPVGMYSHIARVDAKELLFLAGQVAVDENGEVLAKGDAGAQTRIAYEQVGAILADAGATYQDIVQVRTYLVGTENRQSYLDERERLFGEIYADRVFPPNALVFVDALFEPDMLVEIEVIAAIAQ